MIPTIAKQRISEKNNRGATSAVSIVPATAQQFMIRRHRDFITISHQLQSTGGQLRGRWGRLPRDRPLLPAIVATNDTATAYCLLNYFVAHEFANLDGAAEIRFGIRTEIMGSLKRFSCAWLLLKTRMT
ncbi:hypothetical protein J6590_040130 [Homalodisca vitripennis]|nr:hypothetical protein J6590_040130 [Homalodisca vitripennis]